MPFKLISILLVLLSVTACSNKPDMLKDSIKGLWIERQLELKTITAWNINGRLGVKTAEDAWSASLKWEHNNDVSRLRIIAPFHGTYEIKQEGTQYSMSTPENEKLVTEKPEQVMQHSVGWSIPVHSLSYWVRGLTDDSLKITLEDFNEKGELIELKQSDWQIKFSNYKAVKNYSLPGKIILSNQYATITLLNKEWKIIR